MQIKKLLCVVLSLAMVLSLAACGGQQQEQGSNEPEVVEVTYERGDEEEAYESARIKYFWFS